MLIEKVRSGGYGFATERIVCDYRVKHAYIHNFRDCLRDAVIDYAKEQLIVIKDCGYIDEIVNASIDNLQKQLEAYKCFDDDWNFANEYDEIIFRQKLKELAKEGVDNEELV